MELYGKVTNKNGKLIVKIDMPENRQEDMNGFLALHLAEIIIMIHLAILVLNNFT